MTQEDKAKAYDKVREKIALRFGSNVAEEIFSKFEESEDERIRKAIRTLILSEPDIYEKIGFSRSDCLAWLEKQNEKINPYSGTSFKYNGHTWGMCARDNGVEILFDNELKAFVSSEKSFIYPIHPQPYLASKSVVEAIKEEKVDNANKVKPKFHEGDWIVTPENKVLQITSIEGTSYRFNNEFHYWEICYCDEQCRLWTIQDAKDGDVLFHSDSASNGIFIFKEILDRGFAKEIICYCDYDSEDHFCLSKHHTCCWADAKILHPATLEQRDLLFQKMKEAGYMWNSESKQLLSLKTELCDKQNSANLEEFINELSKQFPDVSFAKLSRIAVRVAKWAKPTDEEMKELLRTEYEKGRADTIAEMKKPAWNGEDECYMSECIGAIATKDGWSFEEKRKTKHWLKSLKDRIGG